MPLLHPIDREAALPAALGATPAAVALVAGRRRTAAGLLALPVALALFFRDPERRADRESPGKDDLVSPADGKVMHAGPAQADVVADLDPSVDWQQVSIFLSVFDVHINRLPYAGTIQSVSHRPGRWLAAYKYESAFENERSEIEVVQEHDGGTRRYVVRQIVGLLARRVVTRVEPGAVLATGERIGLMKFGSRMDVFLPPEVELVARRGERVVAGESVIARWR